MPSLLEQWGGWTGYLPIQLSVHASSQAVLALLVQVHLRGDAAWLTISEANPRAAKLSSKSLGHFVGSNDSQVKSSSSELDNSSVKQSVDRAVMSSSSPRAATLGPGASVSQSSSSKKGAYNSLSDNAESTRQEGWANRVPPDRQPATSPAEQETHPAQKPLTLPLFWVPPRTSHSRQGITHLLYLNNREAVLVKM
eukprot:4974130-Amphidinium_carterae.1